MKRSRDLLGAKVFDEKNNYLGVVRGIDYEHKQKNIKGFYIERNGILSRKMYFPFNEVAKFGEKEIFIKNPKDLNKVSFPFKSYDISYAFNRADTEIGYIADFLIDENVGNILGVEVSLGPFDDINHGRAVYANYTPNEQTGDFIID